MTLRPYKFLVQPIAQEVDDDGNVLREVPIAADQAGQPVAVFGVEALAKWAQDFPDLLDQINQQTTT